MRLGNAQRACRPWLLIACKRHTSLEGSLTWFEEVLDGEVDLSDGLLGLLQQGGWVGGVSTTKAAAVEVAHAQEKENKSHLRRRHRDQPVIALRHPSCTDIQPQRHSEACMCDSTQ